MQFKVKVLMFDLDGTLVDTAPQIAEAANRMLLDLHMPILPFAQIKRYIGEGAVVLIKRCLTGEPYAEPDVRLFEAAQALFFKHYADNVTQSVAFDGVTSALQGLKNSGFTLACVTNKPEKFTLPLLQAIGLAPFFECVIAGDSLPKKKPDPMQLQHICAKFGVLPTEAMLIGDSETDIAAARAAGCYIVAVPYGYNQGKAIDAASIDACINHLSELSQLLV